MEKTSFLMYIEYQELLEDLTDEELGKLLRAIFEYETTKKEPNFTGLLKMAFNFIKANLNRDRKKYDKRCETSAINGSKGGRPRNEKPNSKPNEKPKKPKKADNDNDNEDDNDNDNEVVDDIYDFLSTNFGYLIPPIQAEKISEWREIFTDDIIKFAIEKCCNNNARNFNYLEAILTSWKNKGFKILEECKNETKNKNNEPSWFDEEIKKEVSIESQKEIEEMLKEFI